MTEIFSTKVTRLGNGTYGCRILKEGRPILEVRVKNKDDIGSAFKDMFRMLDKMGYISKMASASRDRENNMPVSNNKFIWL